MVGVFCWRPTFSNVRIISTSNYLGKQVRLYSQLAAPSETISVPCSGNGTISLDIYYPKGTPADKSSRPAVTIFLPRGPIYSDHTQDAVNLSILNSTLQCPVVKINYRFDKQFKFPTPIHDTLAGYDWILQNLLPKRSFVRAGRSERLGVIATCGEVVGGQLALVLALTECRIGEPGVVVAAVNNPVVDWVSLGSSNNADPQIAQSFSASMIHRRNELFYKPENYFDPFASPILFFRTAGINVPTAAIEEMPLGDMDELALSERQSTSTRNSTAGTSPAVEDLGVESEAVSLPRKVSLRYPSVAFRLKLPRFHLTAGEQSPMFHQTEEFIRHLQRSLKRQMKLSGHVSEAASDPLACHGSLRVHQSPGLGLWENTDAGRTRMLNTAHWVANNIEA